MLSAHLQRVCQLLVVAVDDVQHQGLQRVGGDEAMVGAQHAALVVAPALDLCGPGVTREPVRGVPRAESSLQGLCVAPTNSRCQVTERPDNATRLQGACAA